MEVFQSILLCGITICLIQMANTQQPTANIDGVSIIGQTVTIDGYDVNQYLKVPYAEPPIGKLRFQKPKPFHNYGSSEYEAIYDAPTCLQYTTQPYPWYPNTTDKSEDCLYLNIWTPVDTAFKEKKAVMYFIHGGGYRYGSTILPIINGTILALMGDIIVVTVNYRLGYFGFLTSNSSDAPGNVGIWDVLEGLKWVNKNIEAFGGDPTRITIAGESAGSIIVGFLSISPLAKGLFARQIMQNSSPLKRGADNNTQNLAFSQQLAEYVGCANGSYRIDAHPKEVVQCLQGVDGEEISVADYELAPRTGFHLLPQFGDELLADNPRISILKGDFECKPLLIGNVGEPGSQIMTTTTLEYQDYFGFFGEKDPHVNRSLGKEIIRKHFSKIPNVDDIINYYLPQNLTDDSKYEIRTQTYTAIGDITYQCPSIYYAEKCSEQNQNVYAYFYTHWSTNSPWAYWMGTTLISDVPYVFGQPTIDKTYNIDERSLSEKIMKLFASFVKYGEPDDSWPLYSMENPTYRLLGKNYLTDRDATGGPHAENCKFLKPYFGF